MNGSFGFFPYEAMDYKAAQDYLDRKSAAGWALKRVYLRFLARFEPGEGRGHFVDLALGSGFGSDVDPGDDYLQLCADAGWEYIQFFNGMWLFRSLPGSHPVPLQTDKGMEQERFWKKYVLKSALVTVLALVPALALLLFLFLGPVRTNSSLLPVLASCSALVYLLAGVLLVLSLFWGLGATVVYFLRCRRSEGLVLPGRRSARARGALPLAANLLVLCAAALAFAEMAGLGRTADLSLNPFSQSPPTATVEACRAYPVVMGMDLGLDSAGSESRYLDGHRGPLAGCLSYSELLDGEEGAFHSLTVERYDCAWPFLARWAAETRAAETAQRGVFLSPALEWHAAPELGFDQCWVAADGAYLLLRQGNVTALVGCTGLDLTTAEHLAAVRARLDL